MSKEDFIEWLTRMDIPVEQTTDVDKYVDYLAEEFGLKDGSLDAAKDVYAERFDYLEQIGIHPFELTREIAGETYTETRFGIRGRPGAWGRERMYEIAEEIAEEEGLTDIAAWARLKQEEE